VSTTIPHTIVAIPAEAPFVSSPFVDRQKPTFSHIGGKRSNRNTASVNALM
jgi:hypothetical protein